MSNLSVKNLQDGRSASECILRFPKIRFVGVISKIRCLVEDDYNKEIVRLAKIEPSKGVMEHELELFMKKDHVEYGGKQN